MEIVIIVLILLIIYLIIKINKIKQKSYNSATVVNKDKEYSMELLTQEE